MKIETKYDIGQIVYFRTDSEQAEYLITGMTIRPGNTGSIVYLLSANGIEYSAFDFEISKERNRMKELGIEQN